MSKQLEGEIALVTGASRGIGKAIAENLAAQGATVIGTATSEGGAENISAYLSAAGGKGLCLDVTDAESVAAVMKTIEADFGAVSILVNNAGITKDNLLMMMKQDQWDDIINTNLTSIYRLSKAVVRKMMKATPAESEDTKAAYATTIATINDALLYYFCLLVYSTLISQQRFLLPQSWSN